MMTAIEVARGLVGIREDQGPNRSKDIDRIVRYCHGSLPQKPHVSGLPWCAYTVCYCFGQAGAAGFPLTGSSQALKRFFAGKGLLFTDPQELMNCRGAVGGWTNVGDPAYGHVFLVEKRFTVASIEVGGSIGKLPMLRKLPMLQKVLAVGTIEGNTNGQGSANGDGCYRRKRKVPVDGGHELWFGDVSGWIQGRWWPEGV